MKLIRIPQKEEEKSMTATKKILFMFNSGLLKEHNSLYYFFCVSLFWLYFYVSIWLYFSLSLSLFWCAWKWYMVFLCVCMHLFVCIMFSLFFSVHSTLSVCFLIKEKIFSVYSTLFCLTKNNSPVSFWYFKNTHIYHTHTHTTHTHTT